MYYNENNPQSGQGQGGGQQGIGGIQGQQQYPMYERGGQTGNQGGSSSSGSRNHFFPFWGNYPLMYMSRWGHYKGFEKHVVDEIYYLIKDAKKKLETGQDKSFVQDLYEAYQRLEEFLNELRKNKEV